MATTHSAPIDLYEESREGFTEEQQQATRGERQTEARRPEFNGDRDDPAIEKGGHQPDHHEHPGGEQDRADGAPDELRRRHAGRGTL